MYLYIILPTWCIPRVVIYNSNSVQTKKKYRYFIDFYFFDFKPTSISIYIYSEACLSYSILLQVREKPTSALLRIIM